MSCMEHDVINHKLSVSPTFYHFEHSRILFQHQMSSISSIVQDHIRLPAFSIHALIYAPPKVLLCFTTPCKYRVA